MTFDRILNLLLIDFLYTLRFSSHFCLLYRHFWCRGYYVDTVGKNAKKIEEYIRNQLKEDLEYDQMSLKEYIDPFTGEPVEKGR